ncbi:SDR family oxidoreductase [Agitococcus lubricus]|uniref:Short-subunit dehydrogenase n=1 Tax=Agitococcus lubricus TaxID=1077255 RepID=A0A2T5IWQ6_9GAMM|nr:SDR family oxidoreductase [Agitococcus lubricus]PTQ88362.1 short-subunit dehydrogenase [Agitococcus lubricus]
MNYFVTGGTGFIGRFLVERLLKRDNAVIYLLCRKSSQGKFFDLMDELGATEQQLIPIYGDISQPLLVSDSDLAKLKGTIDHVFHLAAIYDMNMSEAEGEAINNEGTRHVVNFCNQLGGDVRLHHMSSIAVAGTEWEGVFNESMFDEGQRFSHPYYRSKFISEKIVREESTVPYRIYRPGMVVGDSNTGVMDKIDGPYYFFKMLQRLRDHVPKWLPLLGITGGQMPLCPVNYVADATDYIAHKTGLDGRAFCLVQHPAPTVGEFMQIMLQAAHGPEFAKSFDLPDIKVPHKAKALFDKFAVSDLAHTISKAIGAPVSTLTYAFNKFEFDDKQARHALKGSDIECPRLESYADKLWDYWEWYLDSSAFMASKALKVVKGKTVLITGASSGIGLTVAKKLAKSGAHVLLVARGIEKLEQTADMIRKIGGTAFVYPCDLTNMEAIDQLAEQVLAEHGHIDILINNAGRSIRRAVVESFDRFHDFERTMQLNYFGAIRLIMRLLPSMQAARKGQIINISSIGCLANAPRFSAYVASKAALDAFTRCLSAEVRQYNIETTAIYMPLVRTPMIAPTKMYDYVPTYTPDQAANLIIKAIVSKPKRIKTPLGQTAELSYAIWPKINDAILSLGFKLFPSSAAARGVREEKPSAAAIVLANVLQGQHW